MNRVLRSAAVLVLFASVPLHAAPPPGFAERLEALRKEHGAPGLAVAIVEDGKVTMARGVGVTDLEKPVAIDADTNFPIGSVSKAFTAAGLAVLVDQGKIGWDDRVIDHMPEFRMYDPWTTREMTVRDLLVHRSGLGTGAGDLLVVPRSNLTRADIVERLAHIKPATSFRSGYAYDNILYMVAGRLIERVSGQSWEDFTRDHVLLPAGMARATVANDARGDPRRNAHPHARVGGVVRGMGNIQRLSDDVIVPQVAAPAGGIAASANDMARWLQVQLSRGVAPGGGRVFSEAAAREMWKPVVLMPNAGLPAPLDATEPLFNTYALGWNVRDYRGELIVTHAGGVYGAISQIVMIPGRNIGFFIVTNSEQSELRIGLMYELLDHYLDAPEKRDWVGAFDSFLADRRAKGAAAIAAFEGKPAKGGPSLPLSAYAGRYRDPWFGTIAVREENGRLAVDFPHWPGIRATLEHYQHDSFRARFDDPGVEPAYVTFALGPDGKVERVTMRAVSPIADFSFDYQDLLFTPVAESK